MKDSVVDFTPKVLDPTESYTFYVILSCSIASCDIDFDVDGTIDVILNDAIELFSGFNVGGTPTTVSLTGMIPSGDSSLRITLTGSSTYQATLGASLTAAAPEY